LALELSIHTGRPQDNYAKDKERDRVPRLSRSLYAERLGGRSGERIIARKANRLPSHARGSLELDSR